MSARPSARTRYEANANKGTLSHIRRLNEEKKWSETTTAAAALKIKMKLSKKNDLLLLLLFQKCLVARRFVCAYFFRVVFFHFREIMYNWMELVMKMISTHAATVRVIQRNVWILCQQRNGKIYAYVKGAAEKFCLNCNYSGHFIADYRMNGMAKCYIARARTKKNQKAKCQMSRHITIYFNIAAMWHTANADTAQNVFGCLGRSFFPTTFIPKKRKNRARKRE